MQSSMYEVKLYIFIMACKALVACIFTLRTTLARPATRGDTALNSSGADKDNSDKKQTEGMLFGSKDRETSGQFS